MANILSADIIQNLGLGEGAKLPAATASLYSNGWCKVPLAGGQSIIIQWGSIGVTYQGQLVELPIAFPSAILQMVATDGGGGAYGIGASGSGRAQLQLWVDPAKFAPGQAIGVRFMVIGF